MVNELLVKYQIVGELKHTIFQTIYAGNLSDKLKESLMQSYELCLEEQKTVYKKVLESDDGV